MVDPALKEQLLEDLEQLSPEHQHRVASYARCLRQIRGTRRPPGTPGKDLLPLAGTLDEESAREMREAIEAGCERVDGSEW